MNGFEPIFDRNSRVLILGSFPSVKSRAVGFYYGNPQNRFWKILPEIFGEKTPGSVSEKIEFLHRHGIALWDIVEKSSLSSGSADSALLKSRHKIADPEFLLPPHTKAEKILCNGRAAYGLALKNLRTTLPIIYLPSTSPANVSFSTEPWRRELEFLKKS